MKWRVVGIGLCSAFLSGVPEGWAVSSSDKPIGYEAVPMPSGFRVIETEYEGPVFADPTGRTLYIWPRTTLRNGAAGDNKNSESECGDTVTRTTAGLQSPWPSGLVLPDLDTRPSCSKMWPPAMAPRDAKPIGDWSILPRKGGGAQWAYNGFPVYASALDKQPGDTYGGTRRNYRGEGPALRVPVGPPESLPPEFAVAYVNQGRLLVTFEGYSVYAWNADGPNKSNCLGACLDAWRPILAPLTARARGDWSIVERSQGIRQWAFRSKPLYASAHPVKQRSLETANLPAGWSHVFVQRAPRTPPEFTVQRAMLGAVLADAHGKTIYVYYCGDDSVDQLACDHPETTQALRLAMCGAGDPDECVKTFPPVPAPANAKSDNRLWSAIYINPRTGRRADPAENGAMRVWAFRDRPVYTFVGDRFAGDTKAHNWGEYGGLRNGFQAFWLIDDHFGLGG